MSWGLGPREGNINDRIAARTSWKRYVRHNLGLKVPNGFGWLTDPKRAIYNRVYYRKNKLYKKYLPWLATAALLYGLAQTILAHLGYHLPTISQMLKNL